MVSGPLTGRVAGSASSRAAAAQPSPAGCCCLVLSDGAAAVTLARLQCAARPAGLARLGRLRSIAADRWGCRGPSRARRVTACQWPGLRSGLLAATEYLAGSWSARTRELVAAAPARRPRSDARIQRELAAVDLLNPRASANGFASRWWRCRPQCSRNCCCADDRRGWSPACSPSLLDRSARPARSSRCPRCSTSSCARSASTRRARPLSAPTRRPTGRGE